MATESQEVATDTVEFKLLDVLTLRTNSRRPLFLPGTGSGINVRVAYRVLDIYFKEGESDIWVETEYRLRLVAAEAEPDADPLARVTSRMAVHLEMSRLLSQAEVDGGALEPASLTASRASHALHRSVLQRAVSELGFPRLPFPIEFSEVRGQMEANATAQIRQALAAGEGGSD